MLRPIAAAFGAVAVLSSSLDVCVLYVDLHGHFTIGAVEDNGNLTVAQVFDNWEGVTDGIAAGEEANLFYAQPGFTSRNRQQRYAQGSRYALSRRTQDSAETIASVRILSAENATTQYSSLQPIHGYGGYPSLMTLNLDEGRSQMVASIERADKVDYFLLADVYPQNGTTSKVWLDFTAAWKTWTFNKYGVSTYDSVRGVYYLVVVDTSSVEKLAAFTLASGNSTPVYTPVASALDILALKYSSTRDTLVALMQDEATSQVSYWETPASPASTSGGGTWTHLYSYPAGQVVMLDLGQMELDPTPGSHIAASTLMLTPGLGFALSWVDLQARKEIKRVVLDSAQYDIADVAWCQV